MSPRVTLAIGLNDLVPSAFVQPWEMPLVAIHTMKDFDEADDVAFEDAGGREVGKVAWKGGSVYVNNESRFAGVEEATFNQYIGGYQPLQKWLKDRKGRKLSDADISHYKRIVRALRRTAALMSKIDNQ